MSTNSNYLIILVSKIKIKVKNIKFKNRGNFFFYFLYKQIFDQIKFIILKKKDKWNNEKLKEKVKKEKCILNVVNQGSRSTKRVSLEVKRDK